MLASCSASAATYTWTGNDLFHRTWFSEYNWSPLGVPGPDDTIFAGGGVEAPNCDFLDLRLQNGIVGGTFRVKGTTRCYPGYVRGHVTVLPGGELSGAPNGAGASLTIVGSVTNHGSTVCMDLFLDGTYGGGVFRNELGARFVLQADGSIGGRERSAWFENRGHFQATASPGRMNMAILSNSGTAEFGAGTLDFGTLHQTAGELRLNGSRLVFTHEVGLGMWRVGEASILGGSVSGSGVFVLVAADTPYVLTSKGTISPGPLFGRIEVVGNLAQSGSFDVDLGGTSPGVRFDQLVVSHEAQLGGVLNVALAPTYRPSDGEVFEVLVCGSRVGTFTEIKGLDLGGGLVLIPEYLATGLTLRARGPFTPAHLTIKPLPSGHAEISVRASGTAAYRIESSDTLVDWRHQGSVALSDGAAVFTDTNAPTHPRRFYRAVVP